LGIPLDPDSEHAQAHARGQYDTAIGLLDSDFIYGRSEVRQSIAKLLDPDLSKPRARTTHSALLTLSKNREGRTRLVTTNFDRIFETLIEDNHLNIRRYKAPFPPIPKQKWDGIVYLHGLLPHDNNDQDLNDLVISSGDFGLAYLVERWAARFVSDLFKNYNVCFVGYSLEDPVMRYMMDALDADRQMGEESPEAFFFVPAEPGEEETTEKLRKTKNVTPILYKATPKHTYLHRSIASWASIYRDGIRAKERIIIENAFSRPTENTEQDDFKSRVLWALAEPSGVAAKTFANMYPVPPLAWLNHLSETRFGIEDLPRFGIEHGGAIPSSFSFSFFSRPAPCTRSLPMSVAARDFETTQWDKRMDHLSDWLLRHLNSPQLALWLADQGGRLALQFKTKLKREIDAIKEQQAKNHSDGIRAPEFEDSSLSPAMEKIWGLFLNDLIGFGSTNADLLVWRMSFSSDGLTPANRIELRRCLAPKVQIRRTFPPSDILSDKASYRVSDLVNWDIVLGSRHPSAAFYELERDAEWAAILPDLLLDFEILLLDALRLLRHLTESPPRAIRTYISRPSIAPHEQNRDAEDWTVLVDFLRAAWDAVARTNSNAAAQIARRWIASEFPLLKRLALYGATNSNVISQDLAVDWLLSDKARWFWSIETEREVMRLLSKLSDTLKAAEGQRLEQAIISGPPTGGLRKPRNSSEVAQTDYKIWHRLEKLRSGNHELGPDAALKLRALSDKYPKWKIPGDESDEFAMWVGDADEIREFVKVPRVIPKLAEFLRKNPESDFWTDDDWNEVCAETQTLAIDALRLLAKQGIWPSGRWRTALQVWSDSDQLEPSWPDVSNLMQEAPPELIFDVGHSLSDWLQEVAKNLDVDSRVFLSLIDLIIDIEFPLAVDTEDAVLVAINHPVGKATRALLSFWFRDSLVDNQGIPKKFRNKLELFLQKGDRFRHARVLVAANAVTIYRIDPKWSIVNLVPQFSWDTDYENARAVWSGFLWTARLYPPFIAEIRQEFIATAGYYNVLGKYASIYAQILTFAALDPRDIFKTSDLRSATRSLPVSGLEEAGRVLVRTMEAAGDQSEGHWENRLLPYFRDIWPRSKQAKSPRLTRNLGHLCIVAGELFPRALDTLGVWLEPSDESTLLIHFLAETDLCREHPDAALDFLKRIVDPSQIWRPGELRSCLNDIRSSNPVLAETAVFDQLESLVR
jgi:hypothetical protein